MENGHCFVEVEKAPPQFIKTEVAVGVSDGLLIDSTLNNHPRLYRIVALPEETKERRQPRKIDMAIKETKKWDRESISAWISSNRFRFERAGVWLAGREPNVPAPELYETAGLRVLVVRLSNYHYVVSSMSHGLLGQISETVPGVYVDYAFMPPPREGTALAAEGIPPLFGTASRRPFSDFDVVAVSNAIAQELVNLPWLLHHSGIPFDTEERLNAAGIPLLILGGANAQSAFAACPEKPGGGLSLVDALYFGEAETCWPAVLARLLAAKASGVPKRRVLRELAERFPPVYVPSVEKKIDRRLTLLPKLEGMKSLTRSPLWYDVESLGYANIAVDSGCPSLCRFCKEAWEKRPYRVRPVGDVLADIREAKKYQGLDSVNLFSFNFGSHPQAATLLEKAGEEVSSVSIKSLRFDGLLNDNGLAGYLSGIGKKSFTFGLEGVSERLRSFLNKRLCEGEALSAMDAVYAMPLRQIKIFLIVTGYENAEDLAEFDSLLAKIGNIRKRSGNNAGAPVILSLTPLIPMPHTPLQFNPCGERAALERAAASIRTFGRERAMLVRESVGVEEAEVASLLLFAGGAQTRGLVSAGLRYTYQHYMHKPLLRALEGEWDDGWKKWVAGEKTPDDRFPWDILQTAGASEKEQLYKLFEKAKDDLRPAGGNKKAGSGRSGKAADTRQSVPKQPELFTFWFLVETEPRLAGVPVRFFQAALARAFCLADEKLAHAYWRPGPACGELPGLPTCGSYFFSLKFRNDVTETLKLHEHELKDLSGFRLLRWSEGVHDPRPEGVILSFRSPAGWKDEFMWEVQRYLNEKGVAYENRKFENGKIVRMTQAGIKLTGCHYLAWDFKSGSLLAALIPGGNYGGLFSEETPLGRLPLTETNVFRILSWWKRNGERKCPVCRLPEWMDAFDGETVIETPCAYACRKR
jgi:radical SAM superfamily enzyme YgiQ (UPF0313 family)